MVSEGTHRSSASLRSVCVSPYLPYPGVDHAGGDYLYRYLDHLVRVRGWKVSVVVPGTPANLAKLDRCPFEVVVHPVEESPSLGRIALRLVHHGANTPNPRAWVDSVPPELDRLLRGASLVDLQWSESILFAPSLRRRYPGLPIVGTAHDVLSQSVSRGRGSPARIERARSLLATRAVLRAERAGLQACDLVLVFNPENEAVLRAMGVTTPVGGAPAFVELSHHPGPTPGSHRVLFTGAIWRPENSEAARWLVDEVIPLVRREVPDVTVRIAGSGPPPDLTRRAGGGLEVTGYLPDLAAAYADVGLVVTPLQRGAGLKFKVLQAMASGYPVVATEVAAEGVEPVAGHPPTFVVDDPAGFARAVVDVLLNHEAHLAEARRVASDLHERLGFGARADQLAERLEDLVEQSGREDG